MRISPVSFGAKPAEKIIAATTESVNNIPTTVRHNSLSDMEFSIVADKIRSQNLKNQMDVRLMTLRRSLNSCMAQNLYK